MQTAMNKCKCVCTVHASSICTMGILGGCGIYLNPFSICVERQGPIQICWPQTEWHFFLGEVSPFTEQFANVSILKLTVMELRESAMSRHSVPLPWLFATLSFNSNTCHVQVHAGKRRVAHGEAGAPCRNSLHSLTLAPLLLWCHHFHNRGT